MGNETNFQPEKNVIRWKLHFKSSPEKVYKALSTDEGRRGYWAETAEEKDGHIHYIFQNDIENKGKILIRKPNQGFSVMYFGWEVVFNLSLDGSGGTDMEMVTKGPDEREKMEITAGWVSWLMAMKGYVDFGIDLRNHDPNRTWFQGFVDN